MSRRTVARLAVKSLPPRSSAGNLDEIAGTMLDAGEQSRRAFAVEVLSVIAAGIIERARATTARPTGSLFCAALGWAAVVSLARLLVINLYADFELGSPDRISVQPLALRYVLPALVLLLWTVGRRRAAGLVGMVWGAWCLTFVWTRIDFDPFVNILLPALGCVTIAVAPRQDGPPHRLFWLASTVLLAINLFALNSVVFGFVILGVALCLIPLAPAFGLGTVLAGSFLALNGVIVGAAPTVTLATELIACPLLALAIVAGSKRLRLGRL